MRAVRTTKISDKNIVKRGQIETISLLRRRRMKLIIRVISIICICMALLGAMFFWRSGVATKFINDFGSKVERVLVDSGLIVENISIVGTKIIPKDIIIEVAQINIGEGLLRVDISSIVKRIKQLKWVNENLELFKKIQEDPFVNREWEMADKPFQFLAWVNEWVSFKNVGYGYLSTFICNQDGSCNGIQHYSGILKHTASARAVNLGKSEKPQDVYTVVKDTVIENLKTMNDNPFAKLWLQFKVKRSTVKRAIMTSPYGSTRYSCSDFVDEDLVKRKDQGDEHPFGSSSFQACTFLSGVIWDSMGEVLSSARLGMSFLQNCAKVLSKNGHAIRWVNPVGFPVIQDYPEFKSMRVKTRMFGEIIKPRINVETEKYSVLRASNGLPPNFIHSQDSAHMMKVVCKAYDKGISHFCNVHDSFGTLAADSQVLADTIRETFVELYDNDCPLEGFKVSIEPTLTEEQRKKLPTVPEKGDFNIKEVLQSEFFFA